MKRLIAIPVYHFSCTVGIDKGRAWSVADEILLWAVHRSPRTIGELAIASNLPRSLVVASIARMMRFRLVEVSLLSAGAAIRATELGTAFVGKSLPYFPKRISRRVSFVVDRFSGGLFRRRDVHLMSAGALEREKRHGVDVRTVLVEGGSPTMSAEENFQRLANLSTRGYDEQLASIDGRTASQRDDEVLAIDVVDGVVTGLPRDADARLRALVERLARQPAGGDVTVPYVGPKDTVDTEGAPIPSSLSPEDVLVGGEAHRQAFLRLLERAERRVIVHSTFLDAAKFHALRDAFRETCRRGVTLDILWGAEADDETIAKNSDSAARIMTSVRADPDLVGRVRVHMRSTGSHAKVVLCDAPSGEWMAVVGSCNWLLSPFRAVELSAVLREPCAVATVALALARLVGRRGSVFDNVSGELALLAQRLRERPSKPDANGEVALVAGDAHERIVRLASGIASSRIVVGSHRLGTTARPGALLQSQFAATRAGVAATLVYTRVSRPMVEDDAAKLKTEMAAKGVLLIQAEKPGLHGKFLAWDDHDIVVTSFNWASASVDPIFPEAELGVHLRSPGIGADVLRRLADLIPRMRSSE